MPLPPRGARISRRSAPFPSYTFPQLVMMIVALEAGTLPLFLPLWVQKSWGPFTTSGGGGYWINPGSGNENFWQLGWLWEGGITKALTMGVEIFYFGQDTDDGRDRTGYNIGGIFNLSDSHHILFSGGSDIEGITDSLLIWGI